MKKPMPASHTDKPAPGEAQKIKAEASRKMTMVQWEKSATDAAMDRKVAKREGMSLRQYEGSPLDEKNDRKQLAAHNAKAGGKETAKMHTPKLENKSAGPVPSTKAAPKPAPAKGGKTKAR